MSRHVLQISAGTGPIEVRRFVEKLAARLEAICAARGLVVNEVAVRGDEAAPASVEIVVEGDVLAALADELGTHALLARSADRGKDARKRWYAGVSIHASPETPSDAGIAVDPADLEITATTSPGPGGQHANRTATAVRVRHLPSGITVRVADERSQRANLRRAIACIAVRLAEARARRAAAGEAERRMGHYRVERGAPVRTYRLAPRGELQEMV
ncbi:Peptide chain release factor [Minicystis rosea]|nr:Peptide chain release factor [Minicystis rosea]